MRTGRNMICQCSPMRYSLDHWDMRTGRNRVAFILWLVASLDHWDMRTGRNAQVPLQWPAPSLDHWDMRTGRNIRPSLVVLDSSVSVALVFVLDTIASGLRDVNKPSIGFPFSRP